MLQHGVPPRGGLQVQVDKLASTGSRISMPAPDLPAAEWQQQRATAARNNLACHATSEQI